MFFSFSVTLLSSTTNVAPVPDRSTLVVWTGTYIDTPLMPAGWSRKKRSAFHALVCSFAHTRDAELSQSFCRSSERLLFNKNIQWVSLILAFLGAFSGRTESALSCLSVKEGE
jgi:hypothetical protein